MNDLTHRPHFTSALSAEMRTNGSYYTFKSHRTVLEENDASDGIEGRVRGETGALTRTPYYGDEYGSDGNLRVLETYNELDRNYGQLNNEYSMFQFTRVYTYSPSEDFIYAADYLRRNNQISGVGAEQDSYLKPSRLTQAEFNAVMERARSQGYNSTVQGGSLFRNRSTYYSTVALSQLENTTNYDGLEGIAAYDTLQYDRYQAKENYQGRYRDGFWFKSAQAK